jgi:hypothetical protein
MFAGIQNAGAATTDRTNLNFIGFTIADDAANDRINITAPASGPPRFDTEQMEPGAGPLDVVLSSANVTRLTFTGTNPTLQDIQGGTDTGRVLLCYFNGTGRLRVQHSVAGATGNESRLFNPGNTDMCVGERQGFIAQANGTAGWRTFPFRGSEVIQSFTTAGTSNDVALNGDTTVLRVDTGNSNWSITGFARAGGNFDGDRIVVMNASNTASTGEFQHATGSLAANQLSMIGSTSQRGRRRMAVFEYDGSDSAWREIGNNGNRPFYNDTSNLSGDTIVHNGTEWTVVNNGKQGRLLRVQVFDAGGTFTWSTTAGAEGRVAVIELTGGGGGGGGAPTTAAGQASAGAGGGSGRYRRVLWTKAAAATLTVTVGAGATASAAGAAGNNGNPSSVTDGTTTVSAAQGQGGPILAANSTPGYTLGGLGGTFSAIAGPSAVDLADVGVAFGGPNGEGAERMSATVFKAGNGAFSPMAGTYCPVSAVNSSHTAIGGTGPGMGGCGAANAASQAAKVGSTGGPGKVIVWEYT